MEISKRNYLYQLKNSQQELKNINRRETNSYIHKSLEALCRTDGLNLVLKPLDGVIFSKSVLGYGVWYMMHWCMKNGVIVYREIGNGVNKLYQNLNLCKILIKTDFLILYIYFKYCDKKILFFLLN